MNGMFDFQIFKFVSNKGEDEEITKTHFDRKFTIKTLRLKVN